MKNIFLLPTDKPSRLHYYFELNKKYTLSKEPLNWRNASHVYITSDEEIKEGDFYLYCNQVTKRFRKNPRAEHPYPNYQKIILTTDPELIADGVQAIDDEFLEWLVKNPSCEEVKIEDYGTLYNFRYLILIPQEEPKQEGYICPHTKIQCDDECCVSAKDCHITSSLASGMVDCDELKQEWQQERMYSEQEVGELVYTIIGQYANKVNIMIDGSIIDGLFEQFKKKA
jgi:hypothetical protein